MEAQKPLEFLWQAGICVQLTNKYNKEHPSIDRGVQLRIFNWKAR